MAEIDRSGGTGRRALLVAPALLVTAGLFGGGLILTVLQSVGVDPVLGGQEVNFAAYRTLTADPAVRASLLLTLGVATLSTGLSAALGTALALLLRRAGRA